MHPHPEGPPADTRTRWLRLGRVLLVPALLIPFAGYFLVSVRDLLPQSRYYPQAVAVLLIAVLVAIVVVDVRRWRRADQAEAAPEGPDGDSHEFDRSVPTRERWVKIASCIGLTVLYLPGITILGFYTATGLYTFLAIVVLNRRGVVWPFVAALSLTVGCYLALTFIFDIRLPGGFLI
jgi:hypothetical protein